MHTDGRVRTEGMIHRCNLSITITENAQLAELGVPTPEEDVWQPCAIDLNMVGACRLAVQEGPATTLYRMDGSFWGTIDTPFEEFVPIFEASRNE